MSQCDNFGFYVDTLANNTANLVAKTNHVYAFKWYKADRTPHFCILLFLPTVCLSVQMVTANGMS